MEFIKAIIIIIIYFHPSKFKEFFIIMIIFFILTIIVIIVIIIRDYYLIEILYRIMDFNWIAKLKYLIRIIKFIIIVMALKMNFITNVELIVIVEFIISFLK